MLDNIDGSGVAGGAVGLPGQGNPTDQVTAPVAGGDAPTDQKPSDRELKLMRDLERITKAHKTVSQQNDELRSQRDQRIPKEPTASDTELQKHPALKGYTLSEDGTYAYRNGDQTETPIDVDFLINQHNQAETINQLKNAEVDRVTRETNAEIQKNQAVYVQEVLTMTKEMVADEFPDMPADIQKIAQENVETTVAAFMRATHDAGILASAEQVQNFIVQQIAAQKAVGTAWASSQVSSNEAFRQLYPALNKVPGIPGNPSPKSYAEMTIQEKKQAGRLAALQAEMKRQ